MTDPLTLEVDLGERSYPIVIGSGLLGGGFDLSGYLTGKDCLVVSNETVAPLYLETLKACLAGNLFTERMPARTDSARCAA